MRCLVPIVLLACAHSALAQENLRVLNGDIDGKPAGKMLYTVLQAEAKKRFDARWETVSAIKTPEALKKRQKDLKAKFLAALGGFPEKTPLKPRVLGTIKADGFRIERVIYESRPNHHVTAVLYLPESKGPVPGVLLPCGHSANGKAAEAYQRACILMARHGLAVLCYDPIGQGERIQLLNKDGKPAITGSTSEHNMVGVGALLVGSSTATYRIWDGLRSLDYLASRPEVDPKRLGCTGNSGGGTLTAYLMALDERIAAAAPSCYITSLERLFATIGPQDAEQNITGQVAFGMDHVDYVTMRAPRPTLICVATRDFFDIQGAWTTYREAKLLYGVMGYPERVALAEFNDTHGFSKPRREAALRWMRRWLLKIDDAPFEEERPIFTDAQLQGTRSGQVLEDFKGKSVFHLNAEREKELARERAEFQAAHSQAEFLKRVRQLIALPEGIGAATDRGVNEEAIARKGYTIEKGVCETEPGIFIPGLIFWPGSDPKKRMPLVIYLHEDGKAADAAPGGAIEKLTVAGNRVLALDLRGMGETAPGVVGKGKTNYFGVDSKEAWLSLHLNRPLLGQRVSDVLSVVDFLADHKELVSEIRIVGVGSCGPIALHVAALDPRIQALTLERSVISWSAVVRTPISHNQLCNVVSGALKVYDLPDLAATLAPRRLTVRSAVDPVGKAVTQAELEKVYAGCRSAYGKQKAQKQLTLQAAP
jgi:cephalosporin-C deacetylase-like acetyl esterase